MSRVTRERASADVVAVEADREGRRAALGTIGRHWERMRRGNGGRLVRRRRREVCDMMGSGEFVGSGLGGVKLAGKKVRCAKVAPFPLRPRPALL